MSGTTKNLSIAEEIKAEVEAEVEIEGKLMEGVDEPSLAEQADELTEEEKRLKFIEAIKQSHIRYKPKKHFGTAYKAERKRKNKAQRKSRKANRK
jgi:molybdenum cofactor biosynthesis enzyme MoaA